MPLKRLQPPSLIEYGQNGFRGPMVLHCGGSADGASRGTDYKSLGPECRNLIFKSRRLCFKTRGRRSSTLRVERTGPFPLGRGGERTPSPSLFVFERGWSVATANVGISGPVSQTQNPKNHWAKWEPAEGWPEGNFRHKTSGQGNRRRARRGV